MNYKLIRNIDGRVDMRVSTFRQAKQAQEMLENESGRRYSIRKIEPFEREFVKA